MATKHRGHSVNSAILVAVRMLIASYFLASAGLIENDAGANFLSALLPPAPAEALATTIFYGTAFAIMIGRFVREAALVLALFVFWSSFSDNLLAGNVLLLMEFWQDMALVGAVLLLGLTLPGGTRGLHLFMSRSKPRRVSASSIAARRRDRPEPVQPQRPAHPLDEGDDEGDNIFSDLSTA